MDNFIYDFFRKNHSLRSQRLFRWWLLKSRGGETEDSIQKLWDSEPSIATHETEEDFMKLSVRIAESEKSRNKFVRGMAIAASIAAAAVLGSIITFSFLRSSYKLAIADQELQQITVPNGELQAIRLSDGTNVILGAGSTLIYPNKFSNGSRKIFLTGKAYFDVAKDSEHPFIVSTRNMSVTALGTEFDIDAYAEAKIISSTLRTGSIKVELSNDGIDKEIVIKPDQQLLYDRETHKVSLRNVNSDKKLSWTKGYQIFESASFAEIISALELHYDVRIVCEDADKIKGSYNVKFFPNESVTDVLDILSNINRNFTYRQTDGIVYINVK